MKIKPGILLTILFSFFIASVAHTQDNVTYKYLGKQLERFLMDHSPYDELSTTKSEILMLEIDINKAGKIDTVRFVIEQEDTLFKKSVANTLFKMKKTFGFEGAKPGTYPVILNFLYGDGEHLFRTSSIMGVMNFMKGWYRTYELEPMSITFLHHLPKSKNGNDR